MLEKMSRLAIRLQPWKPLFWLVFIGSLLVMIVQLFRPVLLETSPVFISALIGMLWSLTGVMLTLCFRQVPKRPEMISCFFLRQIARVKRFGYWLLALVFMATTLAVIATTLRLIRIYL